MFRSIGIAVIALVAGLSFAPQAMAQETGVTGELERAATTSPDEKRAYSVSAVEEMRGGVVEVEKMVEAARREGNTEQLQCLQTRLTAMRALLQVSEAADLTMNDALANGVAERADHEFRKIAVALSKSRQLLAEAERCVSDTIPGEGDTTVRVDGPDGDGDETADLPELDLDVGFDPPEASEFN